MERTTAAVVIRQLKAILDPDKLRMVKEDNVRERLEDEERRILGEFNTIFNGSATASDLSNSHTASTPLDQDTSTDRAHGGSAKGSGPESLRGKRKCGHGRADDTSGAPAVKKHRFLALLNHCELQPEIRDHYFKHGDDVEKLLGDSTPEDRGQRFHQLAQNPNMEYLITYVVEYTVQTQERMLLDRVRRIFMWLACYDIVKKINRKHRTKYTGRKLGPTLKKYVEVELLSAKSSTNRRTIVDQFEVFCQRGRKVNQLCKEYGPGCVFYFAKCLSNDFLKDKFVESGNGHDALYAELDKLGLREKARESGMEAWAEKVRAYFRQMLANCDDEDEAGDSEYADEVETGSGE